MRWLASEIAAATNGTLHGDDAELFHVTQDSREIQRGRSLFVPLIAERDGHDFIDAAAAAGAVATLSHRTTVAADLATVVVEETAGALRALGRAARSRLADASVIGITGSVGKTTTKDLLAAVLSIDRPTHASTRSFNNEIGVPLTLLGASEDAAAIVIEMGARGIGHIAELCAIAAPSIGVVTSVGSAHTSAFGSVEAVAQGKGELVEALPPDGVAVLNADVSLVAEMVARTRARVVTYGAAGDVRASSVRLDDELIPRFLLHSPWGQVDVVVGARGVHSVDNALAAAAVALSLGVSLDALAAGLAQPVRSPMRMSLVRSAVGARVIDDTYNANPLSVGAALRSLAAVPATRRLAVLGVMAELGETSEAEHERMAHLAAELGIGVIAVAAPGYGGQAHHVADISAAVEALGDLAADDAVLVKGSRVAELERLVARLTAGRPA